MPIVHYREYPFLRKKFNATRFLHNCELHNLTYGFYKPYIYGMKKMILFFIGIIPSSLIKAQVKIDMIQPPITHKTEVQDTYHNMVIADPYRWLEDDHANETKEWVDQQNTYTNKYLNKIPFKGKVHKDLTKLWNYEKYSSPFKKGSYYFFYKNDGLQNQSVLFYQKGLNGKPEVFIDPNQLDRTGTSALGRLTFSKDNTLCAYSVSKAGSDWQDIYVMRVSDKQQLNDRIEYTKFTNMAWVGNDGFYYSGYDRPKKEEDQFSEKTQFQKIFYHKLGQNQLDDKLVYQDLKHPLRYKGVSISEDQKYLIMYESEGTDGSQISYMDLTQSEQRFKVLLKGFKYNYNVLAVIEDKFYVHTNNGEQASNYQIVAIDPMKPTQNNWQTIVAARKEKLEGASIVGNKIICEYLKNARSQMIQYNLYGKLEGEIELPGIGSASGFGGSIEDDHTFYSFSSFNRPTTIYKYHVKSMRSELFKKSDFSLDPDKIKVEQVFFRSKDGTKVPMFIVHRADMPLRKAKAPTLMYGYGGFNISLGPSFSIPNLYFVQQGGIYVMVNLRGGGEFGEEWHKAGMLEQKQNVFDDFISAGEYLIKEGITTSNQLAISGRSNGGLLVGACMTQRPDLFKVALPGVGVLDMLRYHKFTVGWGWVVEYGSSEKADDFKYLIKYSPLHNLKKNTSYPATLITTADHDDRVVPAHSFKFAATLQEMNTGKYPTLIRIDKQAGHGAGKPTSKVIDEYTDVLSFTMFHLGMDVD